MPDKPSIDIKREAEELVRCLGNGDPCGSHNLARLIEADTRGVFQPFAECLAARLKDHLHRFAELGITNPEVTLDEEVYELLKRAAVDWDGFIKTGRPGEAA